MGSPVGNQARMEGSDVSVPEVMDTWVLQMGYPVVTVNINRQSGSAQISHGKHFLMDDTKEPDPKYPSAFGYKNNIIYWTFSQGYNL